MTRKEEIEQYIEKQTSLKIADNSFDFSNCNAYIISLDLNIDRTNVSRILNQLFIENRLIKVDGRPTLYISKTAIYENLQISSLPSSIKIGENIRDFLEITPSSYQSSSRPKIEIIGIERNESLHSVFQRIASFIMSPFYSQPLCLILSGEIGTGRKYLVEQIFSLAKKKKIFDSSQSIFYCFSMENTSIESICQKIVPNQNPVLLFQIHEINSKTKANLWSIAELYKNSNTPPPVIFILTNPDVEDIEIFGIPSEIFNFPKLCNRSPKEITELILFFFLRLSQSFKRELYITKDILLLFSMKEYKHSHCTELYHYIYSFVSSCLYHSAKHKPNRILLDSIYIPSYFKSFLPDLRTYSTSDFINLIPETLVLKPTMRLNDIKSITNNYSDKIFLTIPEITNTNISNLIFSHSSSLNPIGSKSSELTRLLLDNLQTTILKKDPQLIYLISDIIQNFITDRVSLLKYKVTCPLGISSTVENIYKILMITIRPYIKDFPITESEKYIIRQLISHCVSSIQETKIPILIICHENNVSNNYAHYFNVISKSRKYYCMDYSKFYQEKGIEFFTQELLSIINLINRGKGIILLVDYYPLTTIDSKLVLVLRTPIFSFSPVSISLLHTVNSSNENEAISIATTIIKNQNNDKSNLNNDNLIIKYERSNYPTLVKMKDLFPYLDTTKTNEYLYKSLIILSEKLNIKLNNNIILEYIFHGNCILSNIHLKQRNYSISEILDEDIIEMIRLALKCQPIFSNIQFKDEEMNILYNVIYINIPGS